MLRTCRHLLFGFAIIAALPVLSGCGNPAETLTKAEVACMKELNETLSTIKNDETAVAAKPKIQAVVEKLRGLEADQKKLALSTEQTLELEKKYADPEVIGELKNQSERLSNLKLSQENFNALINILSPLAPAAEVPAAANEQKADPAANPIGK